MNTLYLSLGSNLGNKKLYLDQAIKCLQNIGTIEKTSSYTETQPIGYLDQDTFLNCAIKITTQFSLGDFIEYIEAIQKNLGKNTQFKNGPRTIDIDILLWNDKLITHTTIQGNIYTIPHKEMHKRLFVLEPLKEIEEMLMHPLYKKTIGMLYLELMN